jgi:hypothetical protein
MIWYEQWALEIFLDPILFEQKFMTVESSLGSYACVVLLISKYVLGK